MKLTGKKICFYIAFVLTVWCFALSGCGLFERQGNPGIPSNTLDNQQKSSPTPPISDLPFGNPSGATFDPANKDNFLVVHDSYVLSYNNSRGTMNWIAWKTTCANLGDPIPRSLFEPDPDLPAGFKRVQYY